MFRRLRERFHDDWCSRCTAPMDIMRKQLYALPDQTVGHYVPHADAAYYNSHLQPVRRKADIPPGMYACGLIAYRCPHCGHKAVKATVFLPVRNEELPEQALYFENGELEQFMRESALEGGM